MSHFPLYCETGHSWLGIAEPVNFATNAFILIAAAMAGRMILRSPYRHDWDLWLLVALLAATGIGSFLWHGWRTAFNLALDTYCGLLFLLCLVWRWSGMVWGRRAGVLGVLGLIGGGFVSLALAFHMMAGAPMALRPLMLAPFFFVVVILGTALTAGAYRKIPDAGRYGVLAMAAGLIAATARSVDLPLCPWVPTGTHFLWHGFLSLAALSGIAVLQTLKANERTGPFMAPK